LAAILPHYFKHTEGWVIAPEYWSNDKRRSDFVVFLPYIGQSTNMRYGKPIPRLMCESKAPSAVPRKKASQGVIVETSIYCIWRSGGWG
jgi:hypothetical protein